MRYVILMDVFDAMDDLFEVEFGFIFIKGGGGDILIELPVCGQFHNDEDIIRGIQYLVEFDDIGMVDELEDLDFPLHLNSPSTTFEIIFLFFIFLLLMILTATSKPVRSCLAPSSHHTYF